MDNEFVIKIRELVTFVLNMDFGVYFGIEITILKIMEFAFLCTVLMHITGRYFGGDKQ